MTKDKVQNTIMKFNLFGYNDLVIVALSGGFDSICLLHILYKLGYKIQAAHFNHQIRENADEDMEYVKQVTDKIGIKLFIEKEDVKKYAKNHKISVETAGRKLRYKFFEKFARENNAIIATAHNLNDHAESFIMHLLRGAGLSGLSGISAKKTFGDTVVVRPLIEVSRKEIEEYCIKNKLTPRIDETNASCNYWRNEIRHKVMPPLIERGALSAIARTCDIISVEDDFLNKYIENLCIGNIENKDNQKIINIKWFNSLHLAVRRRIIKTLVSMNEKHSITHLHIDAVIKACEKNYGGKVIQLPGKIEAKIYKGKLIIGG